ncbi:MAG: hypothetical protein RLP02_02235 [Coleofasciculus sp. C2-GNP5-27]
MAKLYYRGMAEENGKPKVGRSARLLGVRPNMNSTEISILGTPKPLSYRRVGIAHQHTSQCYST